MIIHPILLSPIKYIKWCIKNYRKINKTYVCEICEAYETDYKYCSGCAYLLLSLLENYNKDVYIEQKDRLKNRK